MTIISEMSDIVSKEKRSEIMGKIKSKDTKPEIIVRKFLYSHGFRYRLHMKDLPGKPDIVLQKYRTVIFVQGCFWHGHACKIGSGLRRPKSNTSYWNSKISRNITRDRDNQLELSAKGWNVILIWECEVKSEESLYRKLKPLFDKREETIITD